MPVIPPFIYSVLFTPIFTDRYTICAAPAFYLLVAIAISRIRRTVPVYISLIGLMIVILPGLQDYYISDINEQWREAAAYVQENVKTNDIVVYAPDEEGFQHKSFDWYYHGKLPDCGISSQANDQAIAKTLSNCIVGHDRFWVVIRGTEIVVNRMKSFFLNPNQTTMYLIKEQQFVEVSVYLFELK
jgi:mannose-6-phosphate isomerase-like protein (cupin superfamily)